MMGEREKRERKGRGPVVGESRAGWHLLVVGGRGGGERGREGA